ncbi:putative Glucosamine 6-phosphate N-acetyltransferase [Blattamonas nauphoetae]|uniref:Glucosamine 6-phosphate N-acetyltransferase n=1 Tax=Blattamonas nauphoetae TaxID=2049346 RepID=A0ABQ9Y4D2_9EUKA|nr:putative Glucosamine 6-phosphate N-acetyltransferase [Blattamonas nauphoetae]
MTEAPLPEGFHFRKLQITDKTDYLELLSHLTTVTPMTDEEWNSRFEEINSLPHVYYICLVIETTTNRIASAASIFFERKFIHNRGICGHIEEVVTHPDFRKKGLGKAVITHLLNMAHETYGCYKVLLSCKEAVKPFYESCGMEHRSQTMMKYWL